MRARHLLVTCLSQRVPRRREQQNVFLVVLEAGKSEFKILMGVVPGENSLLACRWSPSCHVLTGWTGRKREGQLFGVSS